MGLVTRDENSRLTNDMREILLSKAKLTFRLPSRDEEKISKEVNQNQALNLTRNLLLQPPTPFPYLAPPNFHLPPSFNISLINTISISNVSNLGMNGSPPHHVHYPTLKPKNNSVAKIHVFSRKHSATWES
jgi:hypothetical protein